MPDGPHLRVHTPTAFRGGKPNGYLGRIQRSLRPINVHNRNLWPWRKRHTCPLAERCIDLDPYDFACGTDELGGDRGVIASAATEMQHPFAGRDAELVEQARPKAQGTFAAVSRLWWIKAAI